MGLSTLPVQYGVSELFSKYYKVNKVSYLMFFLFSSKEMFFLYSHKGASKFKHTLWSNVIIGK